MLKPLLKGFRLLKPLRSTRVGFGILFAKNNFKSSSFPHQSFITNCSCPTGKKSSPNVITHAFILDKMETANKAGIINLGIRIVPPPTSQRSFQSSGSNNS